jgi:hypothetical protein
MMSLKLEEAEGGDEPTVALVFKLRNETDRLVAFPPVHALLHQAFGSPQETSNPYRAVGSIGKAHPPALYHFGTIP